MAHDTILAHWPADDIPQIQVILRKLGLDGATLYEICDTQACDREALEFFEISADHPVKYDKVELAEETWYAAWLECQGYLVVRLQCDVPLCAGEPYYYAFTEERAAEIAKLYGLEG